MDGRAGIETQENPTIKTEISGTEGIKTNETEMCEEVSKNGLTLLSNTKGTSIPIKIDPDEQRAETFVITAYCPCSKCCGKWANGITSTGVKAQAGRTIAVDPRKIPYGTKVIIDGHTYVAEDCGGAIKGNRIDIFFNTHSEALKWGRRTKQITILN